jgi:hypothetical protein
MVKSAGATPQARLVGSEDRARNRTPYGVQLDLLEIDSEQIGPPQLVLLGARLRTAEPRLVNPCLLMRAVISVRVLQ